MGALGRKGDDGNDGFSVRSGVAVGVDVHVRRGCPYVVLSSSLQTIESGWVGPARAAEELGALTDRLRKRYGRVLVGIDAPRMALSVPRRYLWRNGWRAAGHSFKGYGRHCEIVVSRYGLAKVQWTRPSAAAPNWMRLGFDIFEAVGHDVALEVFPSASYRCYERSGVSRRLHMDLSGFAAGPKDMLDALIAALTVQDFLQGYAIELGGGDGLGTIVVPTFPEFDPDDPVNRFPRDGGEPVG